MRRQLTQLLDKAKAWAKSETTYEKFKETNNIPSNNLKLTKIVPKMHSIKKAKKSSTNTQAPTKENMNKFLKDPNIPTSNHNLVPNHNLQHPTHYSSPNSSNYENNP